MRILEVRDGFVRLESSEKISLSSFLQITGVEKTYIAQVIKVTPLENKFSAYAKILFLYDGTLKNYDKTLPNKDSEITEFTFDILNKSLDYNTPIIAGKFIDGRINIPIDKECFNKSLMISSDNDTSVNIILNNLLKQFSNFGNTLVIDMTGAVSSEKYIAGSDFRLPLNSESLNFMYEDCLNDATQESKSLIKEIFTDLAEYSKTVDFVPFNALKTIIDDMVDKSHVFKLLVLKNKLAKFDKLGYFASNYQDAKNLDHILESKNAVIDLSKLDMIFQNRYLEVIYSILNSLGTPTQVFIKVSNSINKRNIKTILSSKNVPAVFITHSRFKYINEIKSMFNNFIIEPSFTNNEVFKIYSTFLSSMPKNTYLLSGEGTNYIPFVSRLEDYTQELEVAEPVFEYAELNNKTDLDVETDAVVKAQDIQEPESNEIESFTEVFEPKEAEIEDNSNQEIIEEKVLEPEIIDTNTEEEELTNNTEEPVKETVSNTITEEELEEISKKVLNQVVEDVKVDNLSSASIFGDETEELEVEEESITVAEQIVETVENSLETEIADNACEQENILTEEVIDNELESNELSTEEPITQEEVEEKEEEDLIPEEIEINTQEEIIPEELELNIQEEITPEELEPNDQEEVITEELELSLQDDTVSEELELDTNEELTTDDLELNEQEEEIIPEELSLDKEEEIVSEELELEEDEDAIVIPEEISDLAEEDDDNSYNNDELEKAFSDGFDINSDEISLRDYSEEKDAIPQYMEEKPVIPLEEDSDDFGDIVELDESELSDDDIVVDFSEEEIKEPIEDLDTQITKDVDKVFTTMKEDSISDSDLDFIDELNSEAEEGVLEEITVTDGSLEELPEEFAEDNNESFIEPLEEISDNNDESFEANSFVNEENEKKDEILETRQTSTPIVPVYDADIPQEDLVVSDSIDQGDAVVHAKYGTGIVEKMIKYGTKTLYSINFDNVGRRLLDPTLTEIKKS